MEAHDSVVFETWGSSWSSFASKLWVVWFWGENMVGNAFIVGGK